MAKLYIYDRRDLSSATETQFFHEARAKRTNKEVDTNMPMDARLGFPVKIKRIVVQLPSVVVSTSTAADSTAASNLRTLVDEGVIQLQIGEGTTYYFPLSLALGRAAVTGDLEYTQGTAADASYGIVSAQSVDGSYGIEVDIDWPAEQTIKFYIKTATAVTLSNVRAILEVETA